MATNKQMSKSIINSIQNHQTMLMKDINLKLRLIDHSDRNLISTLIKWEGTLITFSAPLYERDWVIYPKDTLLKCAFITKQGLYMTSLHITKKYRSEKGLLYQATIVTPLEKQQQREHFRLDCLFNFSYIGLPALTTDVPPESLSATCVNISAGGMRIVCNNLLSENELIEIHFNLFDKSFDIIGRIIDEGSINSNGNYTYRLQFESLTKQNESLLETLILRKQREAIQQTTKPLYKKS